MAYRSKSYTYSGGDVIFPIPFDYIKENDIYVFINGNPTTDFIIENHQVKLTVVPSVLPATILIKSQTNITSAVTEWQDTSLLDDLNLTLSSTQLLYSTQELYDAFDDFSTEITKDVTQQVTDLKNETNQQISDFKEEVNETIQEVSDAAEKINELETAVEDAKKAAITAESKATDAALQASNATTQAQLAQQAAQEAEAAVNEIESLNLADKDLSNITEAGKEVIRKNSGSGLSMFDLVVKDHILSYEESKGLALQGSYVYKDAVPGSRYGYPDFYNRCAEEFEDGGNTLLSIKNNVSLVGAPVVDNGVISGFSTSNYIKLPQVFNPGSSTWEIVIPFSVDNLDTEQSIFMSCVEGSSPNRYLLLAVEPNTGEIRCYYNYEQTNWQTTGSFGAENTISTGKKYWVKVEYDGTNLKGYLSTNGSDYTLCLNEEIAIPATASTNNITALGLYVANEKTLPLNGSIDLKESYININGQRIWSGATTAAKNANGHIFYDIADKEVVDDWFDTYGIADFYGVDKENERIFLPRNNKFFQFTTDTTKVNDMVEAGLPNIEGTMSGDISEGSATGALKITNAYNGSMWAGSVPVTRMRNWSFDASLSSPIYGKSDTVQPPSSLKLLYYVVGNTDVQSAVTDIVDVTTTENDTLPLFYNFYAKDEDMADAVSFVKSTGTFFGGNLYPTAYEKLVARVGTGNVKTHTDDYTDYDFVVNQDEMTFRLPLKNGKEVLPGNETVNTLGFSANPTNNVEEYIVPYNGYITIIGYKQSTANTLNVRLNGVIVSQTRALVGGLSSESYFFAKKGDRVTVFTDSASTGWVIATQTITKAIGDGNLYYKLLNAVVNQELVDFAHIQTELNTKLSRSNKEEIVSWGMPDYTAQSTFTLPEIGQTFTVPYDCLLSIYLIAHSAGNLQLRLNNASGAIIVEAASATNQVETQTNVYLKKGWKIYTSSLISYNKCLITPLINAIGAQ